MGRLTDKVLGKPQPVILARNEPVHPSHKNLFQWETLTYVPAVQYEEAPQPVADSRFAGYGRDAAHSPTPLRRFQTLAIAEWNSVVGWPNAIRTNPRDFFPSMPRGQFNPIRERSVISMPDQTTLSDLTAVQGNSYTPGSLSKIAG